MNLQPMEQGDIEAHLEMCASVLEENTEERTEKYLTVEAGFMRLCCNEGLSNAEIAHCLEFIRQVFHNRMAQMLEEN